MSRSGDFFPFVQPRKSSHPRLRIMSLVIVPALAILFQVYVPLFVEPASYVAFPLLVTVYFAVMHRSPIYGIFLGAGIGLVQDSLSHQPIGMFGIAKTLVGYAAASVGMRFDVSHPVIRFGLGFLFFLFHEACYRVLGAALLGLNTEKNVPFVLLLAFVNALISIPLFYFLDKLRENG